jgi:hypothetical protein
VRVGAGDRDTTSCCRTRAAAWRRDARPTSTAARSTHSRASPPPRAGHFEAALAAEEAAGARPWLVRAQVHYAELLAAQGETERASELAAAAVAEADELDIPRVITPDTAALSRAANEEGAPEGAL